MPLKYIPPPPQPEKKGNLHSYAIVVIVAFLISAAIVIFAIQAP